MAKITSRGDFTTYDMQAHVIHACIKIMQSVISTVSYNIIIIIAPSVGGGGGGPPWSAGGGEAPPSPLAPPSPVALA